MNKTEKQIAQAAQRFAERWQGKGYEKGESQTFWLELLTEVYGVKEPSTFIRFEKQVKLDATNFIDAHIPSTRVMIEQKSLVKDLQAPIIQSDGKPLLDARALYPDSSLADLYDPLTMPAELRKAHNDNDRAVMDAYGFAPNMPEPEIVARLFTLYSELIKQL